MLCGVVMYDAADPGARVDMLASQVNTIKLFIASSYRYMGLAVNEVRQAFMLNLQGTLGDVVKHYNIPLNSEYIGGVLTNYLKYKYRMGEKMWDVMYLLGEAPKKKAKQLTHQDWMQMVQDDYLLYCLGEKGLILNTSAKYLYLKKRGYIWYTNLQDYHDWYRRTLQSRINKLKVAKAENEWQQREKMQQVQALEKVLATGEITRKEHRLHVHHVRRLMYFWFFDTMRDFGIHEIFKEVQGEVQCGDVMIRGTV